MEQGLAIVLIDQELLELVLQHCLMFSPVGGKYFQQFRMGNGHLITVE
jgi:hypothetical protein